MIFPIAIIGLIFAAVIMSSHYPEPQPQQHITFKQGVEREQQYMNNESYYQSQGCKPQTIDNTHHVLTWSCPLGTETLKNDYLQQIKPATKYVMILKNITKQKPILNCVHEHTNLPFVSLV